MTQGLFEPTEWHSNMQFEWYRELSIQVRLKDLFEAGFLFFRISLSQPFSFFQIERSN